MILGNISDKDYFSRKEISNSDLSIINKSYLHFLNKSGVKTTDAMVFGKAFDQYLLREKEFWENFIIAPEEMDRRTKDGKLAYQALVESGREILSHKDWVYLNQMRDSARSHPIVSNILRESENEGSYTGVLEGVEVRCKVDLFNKGYIFDIKTTQSAMRSDFKREAASRQYHRQIAFYMDIVRQNIEGVIGGGIIPVEKPSESNFLPQGAGVNCFQYDEESLEVGRHLYRKLLSKYKSYRDNPELYKGYEFSKEQSVLTLPIWALEGDV